MNSPITDHRSLLDDYSIIIVHHSNLKIKSKEGQSSKRAQ